MPTPAPQAPRRPPRPSSRPRPERRCKPTRGGYRFNAGRPKSPSSGVSHQRRESFETDMPIHVTQKVVDGLPSLRSPGLFDVVRGALHDGADRFGMRLIHYSVIKNHFHLIVEAQDARALARGMQGLCIRLARRINKAAGHRGKVFADRYYARPLQDNVDTRNALEYTLKNQLRHDYQRGIVRDRGWIDPCSSGDRFMGWEERSCTLPDDDLPIGRPRSWQLREGWMLQPKKEMVEVVEERRALGGGWQRMRVKKQVTTMKHVKLKIDTVPGPGARKREREEWERRNPEQAARQRLKQELAESGVHVTWEDLRDA